MTVPHCLPCFTVTTLLLCGNLPKFFKALLEHRYEKTVPERILSGRWSKTLEGSCKAVHLVR